MYAAATTFADALGEEHRTEAVRPFDDDAARRWIEYRPRPRPGVSLIDLGTGARKAAHRLLATALSPHAYAQATAVFALEEVLDRREGWRRGRHSDDYRVVLFGTFGAGHTDDPWGWRIEGHHVSVTMTVADGQVSPAPVFLGANPARVAYRGRTVVRPLAVEEDLGRELLLALSPAARRAAVVADEAPSDLYSATRATAQDRLEPAGVASADLGTAARALLDELVLLYLDRLPTALATAEARRIEGSPLHFAWEGPPGPGARHYYRVQGDD